MSDTIKTAPVAGAAYPKGSTLATLTHAVIVREGKVAQVLCDRVKLENILDDFALMTDELPTCVVCRRRVQRRKV